MVRKILKADFFNRDTVLVAKDLLGKFLVRKIGRREISVMIREVEIYDGFKDKASHASRGRTARNEPMFGPAGRWYVYFTYGMHWMLNIVTREEGYPAAILIRAASALDSYGEPMTVLNGPAKITKFLKIDKKFNGLTASKKTGLWIEDGGIMNNELRIMSGTRIGVDYAGQFWVKRKWRFWI